MKCVCDGGGVGSAGERTEIKVMRELGSEKYEEDG